MKAIYVVITLAVLAQGTASAQLLPPPPDPAFQAALPAGPRSLPSASGFYASSIGLPPADPLALELYRADPKLSAGFAFNPNFGIEANFVNPLYSEVPQYLGLGPRLAQGVPLGFSGPRPTRGAPRGVGGFDADLSARLTVPVDDRLSAFGKVGVAATQRKPHAVSTTEFSTAASLGATYQRDNGQTITAEAPLGTAARKALTGAPGGYGGRVKLGF